jgi:outer membrane lipoprotein-sorting protein
MKQMMRFILCSVLISGFALADDKKVSTGDAKTDAAIVDFQGKRGQTALCQARLRTVYKVMDQEIEEVLDAFFKAPNLMSLGVSEDNKWMPSMVSDAGLLWTYDAAEKMVTKFNRGRIYRETELEVDAYVSDPLRPFRGVIWESIRLKGASDKDTYVFEASLKPNLLSAQLPAALVKVTLAISTKDGLLRAVRAFDMEGNEVVVRQYEEMRVNTKISDTMFEFVIPSGAHVIDGTGDAIELLKSLSASD